MYVCMCVCMYVCVCVVSTFSNNFSSEITGPTEAKFHMEPPWFGRMKVHPNGPGHITKTAAMLIYTKHLRKSSPEPKGL